MVSDSTTLPSRRQKIPRPLPSSGFVAVNARRVVYRKRQVCGSGESARLRTDCVECLLELLDCCNFESVAR